MGIFLITEWQHCLRLDTAYKKGTLMLCSEKELACDARRKWLHSVLHRPHFPLIRFLDFPRRRKTGYSCLDTAFLNCWCWTRILPIN